MSNTLKNTQSMVQFYYIYERYEKVYNPKTGKYERTHRIVSKDDKDYYQYHEVGLYPSNDYDVYEYRFMCPSCNNKISFFCLK